MQEAAKVGRSQVNVEEFAARLRVDVHDLCWLYDRLEFDPVGWETEVPFEIHFERFFVRGLIDVRREVEERRWSVIDYKTTQRIQDEPEPVFNRQLHCYGVATYDGEQAKSVDTQISFTRRGEEGWTPSYRIDKGNVETVRGELEEIGDNAITQFDYEPGRRRYEVSDLCGYCAGRQSCPAVKADVAKACNAVSQIGRTVKYDGEPIALDNALAWFMRARIAGQASKGVKDAVRPLVEALGPIDAGRGKVLAVRPKQRRVPLSIGLMAKAMREAECSSEVIDQVVDSLKDRAFAAPAMTLDLYGSGGDDEE
jgi:hypothetical protein